MYLSKLELHGFKSFATRTVLHFADGVTAIVGPNGCGKSNIVDAVRWVIGEQRARILRSEKMENVIFNGTARRRPLGMAEVLLTIENTRGVLPTEYAEVTLGRRLYRSGESEYLLNGVPCRLRDIVDLFMDTGMGANAYSVIELKMIEEILSDNAQDRRHLFEEAAGITKYKQRRAQTLRKLDATQADLTRLRDLTEEIEKRVRSLKRQAAKAARYQEHEARLRTLELMLAQVEHDRLTEQHAGLDAERQRLHDTLEEHTARLAKDEATREALRKTLVDQEQILSEQQQRLNDYLTRVHDLEADLRLEQERLDTALREQERATREQEQAHRQRLALEHHLDDLSKALETSQPRLEAAEAALHAAQERRDAARSAAEAQHQVLQALRSEEQQAATAHAELQRRLDRLSNRLDLLQQEQERLERQRAEIETQASEHATQFDQAQKRLNEATQARDAARDALASAEREHAAGLRLLEETRDVLRQHERQHDALTAEAQLLESLVASYEEFSGAVQFLAAEPSWTPAAVRTVAEMLTCAPPHRLALNAALGDLAECLVVPTEEAALVAAARLREEEKGRATFLVLDHLPPTASGAEPALGSNGATARPLHALIEAEDATVEALPRLLLRGWYLVETLDQARALAATYGPARFVTPQGEWLDTVGLLHAGSAHPTTTPGATRQRRREQLSRLRADLEALRSMMEPHGAEIATLQQAIAQLPLEARRQDVADAEQAWTNADRDYARRAYEREAAERRRADLDARLETLSQERDEQHAEVEPLQTALAEAATRLSEIRQARERAESAFLAAEADSRTADDRYSEASVAAVEARNEHDNLRRDLDRTRHDLDTLAERAEERRTYLASLQDTLDAAQMQRAALQEKLATIRDDRTAIEDDVARAKTDLLQTRVDIDQVELRLRKLRQAREETIQQENVHAVRQAEIQTRKEDLLLAIEENFGRKLVEEPVEIEQAFDEATAREDVRTLRERLKGIGSVNALALEEYEEEKTRFEFMHAQQQDLERAEATLLQTIDEINVTAAARFAETYEAIRTSFQELFSELFGQDATADLILTDADDPLEAPIDILAKPRGKRPIHISQLSSGEKTLTAIALLFAIYLVKPSPFCILDEVDAPLDDANVDRFMRLIRRFAAETQFILVTHNKRTMELADRLYGITMQEQGVSRLVGVRFDEALALAS